MSDFQNFKIPPTILNVSHVQKKIANAFTSSSSLYCSSTGAHTHKRKLGHVPLKVSQVPSGETAATSATHRGRIYLLHQSNVKLIDGFERFQINYLREAAIL